MQNDAVLLAKGARMQKFYKLSGLFAARREYFFVAAALFFTVCASANIIVGVLR